MRFPTVTAWLPREHFAAHQRPFHDSSVNIGPSKLFLDAVDCPERQAELRPNITATLFEFDSSNACPVNLPCPTTGDADKLADLRKGFVRFCSQPIDVVAAFVHKLGMSIAWWLASLAIKVGRRITPELSGVPKARPLE